MSNDVLITPASRKIEFKDSSANVDAKIETDASGNLVITNTGGDISIGDTTSDIFVGDGTNNIDIVFEQDGEIRGTTGVTVTLGASDSNVRMATDLNLNSNAITNAGSITGTSFSDGTISGITFIDEDSFATNSATRVPTQQSIKAYVDAEVAGVVDSAPAALNTLNELAAALGDDASFSTTTSTALGNRLRVDTAAQGLTGTQQANAITNLGITATKAELNYVDGVTSNIQTQLDGKQATGSYLTGNQTITLSGDVSGSGTTSIAVTIADDSHNHVISNVDGLQTALDAKLASSSYTAADVLTKIKTVDGAGSGLDADTLDGISSASFLRSDAADTFTTLSGTTINLGSQVSLAESSHRADLLAITSTTSSWGGITIANSSGETLTSFMGDGSNFGIYDDLNNEWALLCTENSEVRLYHNGSEKLATRADGIELIGNITLSGTVDGRDIASDGSKLDGIESGATADQTAAEILTAIKTVDGSGSGLDADLLDGQSSAYYQPASSALTTSTSFGGDVSGTYNAIVIANDSHTHTFDNLTGKQAGTGDNSTSGDLVAGRGSGSIAMTINDGYGNSNLTFNHQSGTPDQNGNAARIEVNTDSSTNASMNFEVKSGVTGGTPVGLTTVLNLAEGVAAVTGNITVTGTVDGRDIASDGSKLDGIESGATADQTAAQILTAIKTVDGAGSGLDADLLDGISSASFLRSDANDTATGNITFNGDIYGRSVNAQYSQIYRMGGIFFTWDSDSYGTNLNHSITS